MEIVIIIRKLFEILLQVHFSFLVQVTASCGNSSGRQAHCQRDKFYWLYYNIVLCLVAAYYQ